MSQERRTAERLERRRRLQEVARSVFAANGFAGSSIEQIARAAQMSVGAIYLHFRSKDDLCVSLVEDALERLHRDLEQTAGEGLHVALARSWLLLVDWATAGEHARTLRMLTDARVRGQLSLEVADAVARGTARVKAHLSNCVRAGVDAGLYRNVDADAAAEVLWALLLGCLDAADIHANLSRTAASLRERAHHGFALVERGLLATVTD